MAHIDIFTGDAFAARELSESVREIPNQWGQLGNMGLFTPRSIRGTKFSIESKAGVLHLVQSSTRGTPLPSQPRGKRAMRPFETFRFGLSDQITADDVDGVRAFGSESELSQVEDIVLDVQTDLRGSVDVTREYLRMGALKGVVLDADGTELINLYDAFGIQKKTIDFRFSDATTKIGEKCRDVTRHIKRNLKGDVMTGVQCLMEEGFTDYLFEHQDFRERFDKFANATGKDPLRDDASDGLNFQGIYFKEYAGEAEVPQGDGSSVVRQFMPQNEAMFFPLGTRQTFRDFNGSADYMDLINQPGQPMYSALFRDPKRNAYVDVEVMMQTLPMCLRPGAVVNGTTT
ncbi:major capsid protein [Tritonibacter mobilis]|uniref:major capsid protein n=1 Tax=Tritonibacter mobilis TaxID=379347 RepID=UPI000806D993|nr:major capsid protein [Tritonibacter mobilis]